MCGKTHNLSFKFTEMGESCKLVVHSTEKSGEHFFTHNSCVKVSHYKDNINKTALVLTLETI